MADVLLKDRLFRTSQESLPYYANAAVWQLGLFDSAKETVFGMAPVVVREMKIA